MGSLRIISVTGAHSGCGKTTVIEMLLRGIPGRWGVAKFTKTALFTSLIESPDILNQGDKDTARYIAAGASQTIWVQSTPNDIIDTVPLAIDRLAENDGIIVEGNAPSRHLGGCLMIFVFGEDTARLKEGALTVIERAGIVICPRTIHEGRPDIDLKDKAIFYRPFDGGDDLVSRVKEWLV